MAAPEADLMDIGLHCAHEGCSQLDFLPFRCNRCGKTHCLEHRFCRCSGQEDTVLVCPLCARAVVCPPGSDVELVFDRHTRAECDPTNYARVHRKPRCPVPGCKEKLTAINSFACKACTVTVCLKHRLGSDHACPGRPAAAGQASVLPQSWRRMFSVGGTSGGAHAKVAAPPASSAGSAARPQQPRQAPAAATAVGGSGARRPTIAQKAAAAAAKTRDGIQSQLQQYRQQQRQRGQPEPARAAPGGAGSAPELCQQCGARFSTVQQLIEHAEAAHAGGWASGAIGARSGGAGGLERCPHCGREFADAVQLVAHVEQQHAAQAASTCVCS